MNRPVVALLLLFLAAPAVGSNGRLISVTWTSYKQTGPDVESGRQYKIHRLYCSPGQPCRLDEVWIEDRCDKTPKSALIVHTHTWEEPGGLKVLDDGSALTLTVQSPSGETTTHRLKLAGGKHDELIGASGSYVYVSDGKVTQGELASVEGKPGQVFADLPLKCRKISVPFITPAKATQPAK